MKYNEAFKIGSKADGFVKCTYAQLANYSHGVVWSLQKAHYEQKNTDAQVQIAFDVPVVKADTFVPDATEKDWIPVKLTTAAIEIMYKRIAPSLAKTYQKMVIYAQCIDTTGMEKDKAFSYYSNGFRHKLYQKGDIIKVREITNSTNTFYTLKDFYSNKELKAELYKTSKYPFPIKWFKYYYALEGAVAKREDLEELVDTLKSGEEFYVKAAAIDWQPSNIENASIVQNGKEILLSDALAAAKKKVEQAKAILAGAATISII